MRTVGVKLVADVAAYEAGIKTAEETTKSLGDEMDKTGFTAKQAAEDLDKVTAASVIAGKEEEKFGRSALTAAQHMEKLDREIHATERELQGLAISFAEAQTAADRLDLSKSMRKTQSDLRTLNKSKGLLGGLLPSEQEVVAEGEKVGQSLEQGITSKGGTSASGFMAVFGPGLIGGAVALAPAIGAVISGAVVGAVGVGGIVGGLLLASQDPRVSSALSAFEKKTLDRLKGAAAPFVPVALAGIREIDGALQSLDFKALFSDAAKQAGPLIHGIAVAVEGLGRGITDLIHNAGPAVAAIGDGIGQLGQTIGAGLAELSSNGKEGADALRNLFAVINIGLESTFGLLDVLTKVYGVMRQIGGPGVADAARAFGDLGTSVSGASKSIVDQALAAHQDVKATKQLSDAATDSALAIKGESGALEGLASILKAQTDPVFAIVNAQKQLTAAQKAYTDAVSKHGRSSDAAKAADQQLAAAALDLEGNVGKLGKTFNGKLTPEMIATFKAAHLTAPEIAGLAAQFAEAKRKGDAFAKNYAAHASVQGVATAKAQVQGLKAELESMKTNWNVTIRQRFLTFGKPYSTANPQYGGLASGGPISGAGAKGVDSELRLLAPGEHVWTAAEVDAAGGQKAMTSLRAAILSHTGWSATPAPRMMPVGGGGAQRIEVVHRQVYDFANASGAMAQALISTIRTDPGVRRTLVKTLQLKGQN